MIIDFIRCPERIREKLATKHRVAVREAREVLLGRPRIRFAEKGHIAGDDVYAGFGQTFDGRYLAVFFVYKSASRTAIVISARDMHPRERDEPMGKSRLSSVSRADSLEKMGEFWDQHDFTEFDDSAKPDAEFTVRCGVPLKPDLLERVEQQAARLGVSAETLVNLWLQEKLAEAV